MEQSLFRILYCSRNRIENLQDRRAEAMSQIFQTARANNKRRAVTGALLYSTSFFAQVLEGPRGEIESIFEKIQQDPRHGDVTILECSRISSRDFPQWSMASVQPVSEAQSHATDQALGGAIGDPGEAGQSVLELMRSLVIQED